jgi:hypothetical protein
VRGIGTACRQISLIQRFWIAALLAIVCAAPAKAGHYEVYLWEGNGTATFSPLNGDSWVESMSSPGVSYNDPNYGAFHGSVEYEFTETLYYCWVPDEGQTFDSDPPQPVYYNMGEGADFWFSYNSGAAQVPGSASATATVDGVSVHAEMEVSPDGNGSTNVDLDQSGSYAINAPVLLNQVVGQFDRTHALTITTDGIVGIAFGFQAMRQPTNIWLWCAIATWAFEDEGLYDYVDVYDTTLDGTWRRPNNDALGQYGVRSYHLPAGEPAEVTPVTVNGAFSVTRQRILPIPAAVKMWLVRWNANDNDWDYRQSSNMLPWD